MSGDIRKEAYEYFIKKGWQPHQAAAVVGNAVQESNLDTQAKGDRDANGNPTAFGVMQWRGDRHAGLYDFARKNSMDPRDQRTQLDYYNYELTQGNEKKYGEQLKAAPDVYSANRAVISSLRPAGWTPNNPDAGHGFMNRLNNAESLMGQTPSQAGYSAASGTSEDSPKERAMMKGPPPSPYMPTPTAPLPPGTPTRTTSVGTQGLGLLAASQPKQPQYNLWQMAGVGGLL